MHPRSTEVVRVVYERSDDLVVSLQAAAQLFSNGRFDTLACAVGEQAATEKVIGVAEQFVKLLRKPAEIALSQPTTEEM